jgi:hypothetical protein
MNETNYEIPLGVDSNKKIIEIRRMKNWMEKDRQKQNSWRS